MAWANPCHGEATVGITPLEPFFGHLKDEVDYKSARTKNIEGIDVKNKSLHGLL
jgi:hypothetical protein